MRYPAGRAGRLLTSLVAPIRSGTGGLLTEKTGLRRNHRARGRALVTLAAFGPLSKAFAVSQSDCYPIAKRIQKIVFSLAVLVADPEAFDLVDQVIARFTLVDCGLVEGVVGVFDVLPINVARNREGSLVLAHGSQF